MLCWTSSLKQGIRFTQNCLIMIHNFDIMTVSSCSLVSLRQGALWTVTMQVRNMTTKNRSWFLWGVKNQTWSKTLKEQKILIKTRKQLHSYGTNINIAKLEVFRVGCESWCIRSACHPGSKLNNLVNLINNFSVLQLAINIISLLFNNMLWYLVQFVKPMLTVSYQPEGEKTCYYCLLLYCWLKQIIRILMIISHKKRFLVQNTKKFRCPAQCMKWFPGYFHW